MGNAIRNPSDSGVDVSINTGMPVYHRYTGVGMFESLARIAAEATRPATMLEGWLETLEARGIHGLRLRVGEDQWEIGSVRGTRVHAGTLTLFGDASLGGSDLRRLGALSELMSTWFHRFERFAATSRRSNHAVLALRKSVATLTAEDLGLLGPSPAMARVNELIRIAAPHDTTVQILGETGTGKERVARAIHRLSGRRGRWVALNCGALASGVLEAELFGHERGAFTGAATAREGVLRAAGEGTVFLDEVAELDLDAQARLLRALEERRVRPVGAERDVPFRARIVSATHRDLEARVAEGSFREDLYYRLSVFPIEIPPLRDRREDVLPIAESILAQLALAQGRPAPTIDRATRDALRGHGWRGNVRQLRNELERALLMSGDTLRWRPDHSSPARGETFDDGVRSIIEDALRRTGGRIYGPEGAAALLDLPPSTLQTKMKKLGIRRQ